MRNANPALIAAAVMFVVMGMSGCYTVLVHPIVETVDETTGGEMTGGVTHAERCTDCHTGNVHSRRAGMRGSDSDVYETWSEYDPFWESDSYYEPSWGSSFASPWFSGNYYRYRSVPWWIYLPVSGEGGGADAEEMSEPAAEKEKPVRRGSMGRDDRRENTPLSTVTRQESESGTGKASSSSADQNGTSENSDSGKEKPVRRGGMK